MKENLQLLDIINLSIQAKLVNIHTATIGRVVKVNEKTINIQPVINREVNGESVALPVFIEVPPVFMQGGGSYTAHPIKVGDHCLLIITERSFDNWYLGKDEKSPVEFRMHDYSDGFAIVGVNPLEAAIKIPSVITHIGDTYAEGNWEVKGNFDIEGDLSSTGNTESGTYSVGGTAGVSGTFLDTSSGGHTLTVVNGLITAIT